MIIIITTVIVIVIIVILLRSSIIFTSGYYCYSFCILLALSATNAFIHNLVNPAHVRDVGNGAHLSLEPTFSLNIPWGALDPNSLSREAVDRSREF